MCRFYNGTAFFARKNKLIAFCSLFFFRFRARFLVKVFNHRRLRHRCMCREWLYYPDRFLDQYHRVVSVMETVTKRLVLGAQFFAIPPIHHRRALRLLVNLALASSPEFYSLAQLSQIILSLDTVLNEFWGFCTDFFGETVNEASKNKII